MSRIYKLPVFAERVRNVLKEMDAVRPGMYSERAVNAITMICAHESKGGVYRRQIGGGPALGALQIEPDTHDDVWKHSDTIKQTSKALGIAEDVSRLEDDDFYSIFIARHKIAMDPNPIPFDIYGVARYVKRVWNGDGKATPEKYVKDYNDWLMGEF